MTTTKPLLDLSDHAERFGVRFNDLGLLQRALTHRSYLNEHPDLRLEDNERLEFLGDAVLDFIVAEFLYERFPGLREGHLTRLRAGLVRNDTLAILAQKIGIGEMLLLGKGEEDGGGRARSSNLGSAFEAFAGALYLDQGLDVVRTFVKPLFDPSLEVMLREQSDKDAKSRLQEWAQAHVGETPQYRTVSISGPDHQREFTLEVLVGGDRYGIGTGRNKQSAAQAAANDALTTLQQKGWLD
ncbi:MAG: ribonuclease III [Anaerolineae bacterium]|nr:ribonuclease III [Anaerolineae bacterium]